MKHKIILSVLYLLVLAGCTKEDKKNDLTEANLKGRVKSVRQIPYEAVEKDGKIIKGVIFPSFFSYHNHNNQVKYDDKGNKIEENIYDEEELKHNSKYDSKGNQIEENRYFEGKLVEKYTFKYDSRGNKIEENHYNSDEGLSSKFISEYDNKGNLIERNSYDSVGELNYKSIYSMNMMIKKIKLNYGISLTEN